MEDVYNKFRILTEQNLKQLDILYKESRKNEKEEKKTLLKEAKQRKVDQRKDKTQKTKPTVKKNPDKRLEAGKALPHYLGDYFPKKKYAGKLLEEIDPFYHDKRTFLVINSSKTIFRFSSTNAFFIFSPFNPLRSAAIRILTHSLFSFCVLTTIIINCVYMTRNSDSENVETIFTAIYTAEFIIKALARGLIVYQFTYLRDAWNWLDFIVIGLAYMMYVNSALGKLSVLRSLRVLRALKTVTTIPGMKTVVSSLLMAIIKLRDALVLTVFMLSIFALIGLQMYRGTLLHKCVKVFDNSSIDSGLYENDSSLLWSIKWEYYNNPDNWQNPIAFCHNLSLNDGIKSTCTDGYECIRTENENPNFGYTSFDNFGVSLLCAFRLMTQDFWENLYQLIIRTNGDVHMIYFMMVIFFGSFYLINVILSIVAMSYDDVRMADMAEEEEEEAEKKVEEEKREQMLELLDHELEATSEDLAFCAIGDHPLFYPDNMTKSCIDFRFQNYSKSQFSLYLPRAKSLQWTSKSNVSRKSSTDKSKQKELNDNYNILIDSCPSLHRTNRFKVNQQINLFRKLMEENRKESSKYSLDDKRFSDLTSIPENTSKARYTSQILNHRLSSIKIAKVDSKKNVDERGSRFSNITQEDIERLSNIVKDSEMKKRLSALSVFESENKIKKREIYIQRFNKIFCSWECCPAYNFLRKIVSFIVLDPFMELFITVCIVLNTVFMSIDTYDISTNLNNIMSKANVFFMAIFTLEAGMKLIAHGPRLYFSENWNVFDFIIVILSIAEFKVNTSTMSLLRTFRLLRIFKLAKSWQTMNLLFTIIGRTLGAIGNLCIVLAIIVFIFAVVGMQIFGKAYDKFKNETEFPKDNGKIPRWNFCDFTHSFMIVFRVLCGEYMESMWDCMRVNDIYCIPFFLATMILGNLVILNLFLALLLSSFSSESLQRREDESADVNKLQEALTRVYRAVVWIKVKFNSTYNQIGKKLMIIIRRYRKEKYPFPWDSTESNPINHQNTIVKINENESETNRNIQDQQLNQVAFNLWLENYEPKFDADPDINEAEVIFWNQPYDCLPDFIRSFLSKHCNCFSENCIAKGWWWIRCCAFKIVDHKFFETFILIMIVVSSLTLTFEDKHLSTRPRLQIALEFMDKVFTVIFLVEMILKWFAIGLTKYFKDAWCWLDFTIVSVALVSLHPSVNAGAFKALRTLRALRPLRAVSRWEGMKIVVNALIQAIPSIFNVLLVCLVFWLIFSIIGMQLFGGKFFKCVDSNKIRINDSLVRTKNDCLILQNTTNVSWINSKINFDNVLNGYLSLFQIATFKGWTDIMADAVDITKVDSQPKYNNSTFYYIYFVLFIIFGAFFTLNLFIGVIIDNFNVQKKKIGGSLELFMTDSQKRYYHAMKKMSSISPQKPVPRPKSPIAQIFYNIINNQKFDIVIMCFIMLNTIVMCLESHKQGKELTDALDLMNKVFILIFTLESAIKIIALRWYYFKIPWNVFDFIIVIFSLGFWAIEKFFIFTAISPTLIRVIRVFRIGRVLRLVKSARGIRTLLFSLVVSLPALFNIGLLLMLIMFIYAIIGVSMFSDVAYSYGIDATFNFETFGKAMIILFQISTSGGWNSILDGLMNTDTVECENNKKKCGNYLLAVLYLVSYLVISFLVIINMYIAVILENFSQATKDVQLGLTQDDYDLFYECWEEYDPGATGFIDLKDLSEFVAKIGEPLGMPQPNKIRLAILEIPICKGYTICCVDLMDKLTKNFLGECNSNNPMMDLKPKSKNKIASKKFVISNTYLYQRELWAARKITNFFREMTTRKTENK